MFFSGKWIYNPFIIYNYSKQELKSLKNRQYIMQQGT